MSQRHIVLPLDLCRPKRTLLSFAVFLSLAPESSSPTPSVRNHRCPSRVAFRPQSVPCKTGRCRPREPVLYTQLGRQLTPDSAKWRWPPKRHWRLCSVPLSEMWLKEGLASVINAGCRHLYMHTKPL